MAEVLMLGGRPFGAVTDTTFEQDNHAMALVYDLRLHEVIEAKGDVIGAVLRSGRVTEFLAAVLVELDQDWSPASARENERFFAGLRAPAEKAALSGALEGLLAGFFVAGRRLSGASPSFSSPTPSPKTPTSPNSKTPTIPKTRSRRRRRLDGAPGTTSSTPSPTTAASAPA